MTPYIYKVNVVRVIDGDTFLCDIDYGHGVWRKNRRVRVLGVNCPETRGATLDLGLAAAAFTVQFLAGKQILIQSMSKEEDSFGRILAHVWADGMSLAGALLTSNNAVRS